jgi:hypothetical protein
MKLEGDINLRDSKSLAKGCSNWLHSPRESSGDLFLAGPSNQRVVVSM